MPNYEFVDLLQRMKEIRMSHNFSNDISKQHELYDLVNQVLNFSEGKMSGTEYKIKQLVSKLPSEKKARGTEKLNSMVSSLKKKGLKEKDIISRLDAKSGNLDRLVAFSKKSNKEDLKKAAIIAGSSLLGAGAAAGGAYAANKATDGRLAAWGNERLDDVKDAYNKSVAYVGDKAGDAKDWTLMQLSNGKTAVVDATGKIQGFAKDTWDKVSSKFDKSGNEVADEQVIADSSQVVAEYFSKKNKLKKAAAIAGAVVGTAGAGYGAYATMPHIKEGIDTYKTGVAYKSEFGGLTPADVKQQAIDRQAESLELKNDLHEANKLLGDYRGYMAKNATVRTPENADKIVTTAGDWERQKAENNAKYENGELNYYERNRANYIGDRNTDRAITDMKWDNFFAPVKNIFKTKTDVNGDTVISEGPAGKVYLNKGADAAPVTPENAANDGQSDVVGYFYSNKWGNWF